MRPFQTAEGCHAHAGAISAGAYQTKAQERECPKLPLPNSNSAEAYNSDLRNDGPPDSMVPTAPCVAIVARLGS